jgi:hypothetical protein
MNQDFHISSTGSHALSALVALAATAIVLWLVFTVAGDYYAADELAQQAAQASVQPPAGHDAAPRPDPGASRAH